VGLYSPDFNNQKEFIHMFAVISSGGKQYKVSNDTILTVNKVAGEDGEKITVNDVLFASDGTELSLGSPNIKDAKVNLEIIKQDRDRKILIFKKQRRKNFRRKNGHRQDITFLKVLSIEVPGLTFPKAESVKAAKVEKDTDATTEVKKKAVKKVAASKVKE
jgi:large subunit ribosomal protein L21|tara:strand:+ start:161 stop:643 length:483 start_codon:yes stop_codon:yes gene_type:complete